MRDSSCGSDLSEYELRAVGTAIYEDMTGHDLVVHVASTMRDSCPFTFL